MFSDEEIKYIKNLGLDLNFNELSDDDYIRIEETVGERLELHCLDDNYNPNTEGMFCENILNKL